MGFFIVGALLLTSVEVAECRHYGPRWTLWSPRKGIVKLKLTAVFDAQHGGFTTS